MKFARFFFPLVLASASVFAETDVHFYGTTLNAILGSAEESERLFQRLHTQSFPARNATVKVVASELNAAGLECRESGIVGDTPYACYLWIKNADRPKSGTPVYEADGYIHALVDEVSGAKAMFEGLTEYTADDGKAWFRCSQTDTYTCEIVIKKTTTQYGR